MGLNEITREELQAVSSQLQEALHNHQLWHRSLLRTVVCRLPVDQRDLSPQAHTECRFGQWYYGQSPEKLRDHHGFIAMGNEHQRLHQQTTQLLLAANSSNTISPHLYDSFDNSLERMQLEIYALQRELEDSLFNHDSLTGAISRLNILPVLREQQELIRRTPQLCHIAMMDLDHFKRVNDLHGHLAGDRVLIASVRYLLKHLRPYDKVFRYGGEEFLLCMPHAEPTPHSDRLNELREGLAALPIDIGEAEPIHISASFGLTLLDANVPVETSIDRADKALYAAKAAGRNCVRMWDESM
ncbi:MAG: diguanylate cyclase [Sideroxydans sp.]|nr:diguanylate cyclase [Sideroxydans sp.]